jgi:Xaa-Pro aminopeptidase
MTRIPESAAPRTDWRKLDSLMEESDLDLLIVNSKHNIQYLLNGYRFFFFDAMDAIGISRYLPILVYPRGRPDRAAYIGNAMESYEKDLGRLPLATVITSAWGTQDAMREAIAHIETLDRSPRRIGIEAAFLPADAYTLLTSRMSDAIFVDALVPLERLRARKTADELQFLRRASEGVAASMLAVIASHGAGATKRDLALAMKRESQTRDLSFDYCLVTTGASLNRAPSDQIWRSGEIASLDSGANLNGYIGDLCRMAIAGEPDGELQDLLGEIEAIQQAARRAIRPGALGGDAIAAISASWRMAWVWLRTRRRGSWIAAWCPIPLPTPLCLWRKPW